MDQAQMLTLLSSLYDKLLRDVAAHVIATTAEVSSERISELAAQVYEEREAARPGIVSDAEIAEMRVVAIAVFEEMIEPALEEYDPSDSIEEALDSRDLESEVSAAVEVAVENLDIEETVRSALRNVEFTVSVA